MNVLRAPLYEYIYIYIYIYGTGALKGQHSHLWAFSYPYKIYFVTNPCRGIYIVQHRWHISVFLDLYREISLTKINEIVFDFTKFYGESMVWNQINNMVATALISVEFNSLRPSDAYTRRWTGSSLVQIMTCHLFGAKPLSEPMLEYC